MANKLIRGITIEIGGDTTKLGKALEDTEKSSRSLQSELREIDKALKFDPSNVELIAQKQTVLTKNIEETKKKLDTLKEAERQVIAQFERGEVAEEQVRALQREIIKCENALGDMEDGLKGTNKKLDETEDSAKGAEGGFTIMKGALADLVSNIIQSAVSAIGDLIGSLFELSEATEEYRIMQAKLEGSADTFGYSLEFASEKYKEFYGYVGDDQMATNAITNLMGLGTSTESVSKLAEGAIAVWTAYGDSIPIEGLTESINETAQVGKVTGSLADALNWAGISEDEFNKKLERTRNTQERADLIAKTLNRTYGDSKTTYDELSGSITDANRAELELKDTQAELGETMAPVNTAFTELKNQALEAILPLVKDLATAFLDLLNWLKEHPTAMKILTAVVVTLATAFTVLSTALGIQALINGVTKAFGALNLTMLANPAVLITTAIVALVAGFIYLWNTSEGFREFWIGLWESVKNAVSVAIDWIVGLFNTVVDFVKENWQGLLLLIVNPFAGAFKLLYDNFEGFRNFVDEIISKIATFFVNLWSDIKTGCSNAVKSVKEFFKGIPDWFKKNITEPVKKFFTNLWDSIKSAGSKAVQGVKDTWSSITGWFNKSIVSPISNYFSNMWKNLKSGASGAWSGIKSVFSNVTTWFRDKFSQAWTAVKNVFSTGGKIFSGIKDGIVSAFKNIVNGIIGGINKVIAVPFNAINKVLEKIRNVSIAGLSPFKNLGSVSVPQIPLLYRGGILKKGQIGLLEGNGAEAVVPLEKETAWINRIAQKMNDFQGTNPANAELALKMDEMIQAFKTMKQSIVLDTGVLVGETINQIDAGLSNNYSLRERRV